MKYQLLCLCLFLSISVASEIEIVSETAAEGLQEAVSFSEAVFGPGADSGEVYMFLTDAGGDTLWSCPIQGTSFGLYNSPEIVQTSNGNYLVNCLPDCFSPSIPLQLISTSGETLWFTSLETVFLVDSCEFVEIAPAIHCMIELSNGNFIVAGTVSPYMGASAEWFAVSLDGITGRVLWKNHGHLSGYARIDGVVETSSEALLAVGGTAESIHPGGGAPDMIRTAGEYHPLIMLLESTGECSETWIIDLELTERFTGITIMDSGRFLITGFGSQLPETTETVVELTF